MPQNNQLAICNDYLMKPCFLFILLAVMIGCSREVKISIDAADSPSDTLRFEAIQMEPVRGVPISMFCTEGYLVVSLDRSDFFFYVMPFAADGRAYYCGRIGRGPNEFISMDSKSIRVVGNDSFTVYDQGKFKTVTLSATSGRIVAADGQLLNTETPSNGMLPYGDGYVNINLYQSGSDWEFVKYDHSGKIVGYLGEYPNWQQSMDSQKAFLYMKSFASTEDGRHLAVFYTHFYKARFYKHPGDRAKTVSFRVPQTGDPMQRVCFVGRPQTSEKSVSTICQFPDHAEIQDWNWNGGISQRHVVPFAISMFCVDSKGNYFVYSRGEDRFYGSVK